MRLKLLLPGLIAFAISLVLAALITRSFASWIEPIRFPISTLAIMACGLNTVIIIVGSWPFEAALNATEKYRGARGKVLKRRIGRVVHPLSAVAWTAAAALTAYAGQTTDIFICIFAAVATAWIARFAWIAQFSR